jgi:hypothetical protein
MSQGGLERVHLLVISSPSTNAVVIQHAEVRGGSEEASMRGALGTTYVGVGDGGPVVSDLRLRCR